MGDIKFEFSLEKLIHAIALFSQRGVRDLTKLKIAKMLYFSDKKHLLEHGSPVIGDVYFCMEYGPVPSFSLNEMSEAIDRSEVAYSEISDYKKMNQMLHVKKSFFKHSYFEARHDFDSNVFAPSEISALEYVVKEYGNKSAVQLVDLTHQEPTWQIANKTRNPKGRTPIPYELFFEGAPPEALKYLARLKADFKGEVIAMAGDGEYREFASELASYDFEPSLDLDSEQTRLRGTSINA